MKFNARLFLFLFSFSFWQFRRACGLAYPKEEKFRVCVKCEQTQLTNNIIFSYVIYYISLLCIKLNKNDIWMRIKEYKIIGTVVVFCRHYTGILCHHTWEIDSIRHEFFKHMKRYAGCTGVMQLIRLICDKYGKHGASTFVIIPFYCLFACLHVDFDSAIWTARREKKVHCKIHIPCFNELDRDEFRWLINILSFHGGTIVCATMKEKI